MAYTKTIFNNGAAPAVSAEELNKLGDGIIESLQNADNAKIVTGTYTGNAVAERTISLGFTPSAVLVTTAKGQTNAGSSLVGGLAFNGFPAQESENKVVEIVTGGFKVFNTSQYYASNTSSAGDNPYKYIAWK